MIFKLNTQHTFLSFLFEDDSFLFFYLVYYCVFIWSLPWRNVWIGDQFLETVPPCCTWKKSRGMPWCNNVQENGILDHLKKKNNNNPPKIAILGSGAKVDHLFSPTLYHYLLFILVVCQKLAFLQSSLIQIGKYRKCCFGFSTFFLFFFIIITWMGDNSFHDKNAPAKIMSVIFEL